MSSFQFDADASAVNFALLAPAGHRILSGSDTVYSYAGSTPTEIVYVFGSDFTYRDGYVVGGEADIVLGVDRGTPLFEARLYGADHDIATLAGQTPAEQIATLASGDSLFQANGYAAHTNTFVGGGGNDVFFDGYGRTSIDGGAGNDVLRVDLAFAEASVAFSAGAVDITGEDRADHVIDVELFAFKDQQFAGVAALRTAVEARAEPFGSYAHDVHTPGGAVYALYEGLLGRAPDALEAESWAAALARGLSLEDMARTALASPEARGHLGAADDAGFVAQLYRTVLGRPGEAPEVKGWAEALDHGLSRAALAQAFVLGDEHVAQLQPALGAGVFTPDQATADVARLYYGLLGRAPDAAGLTAWSAAVHDGTGIASVARSFLGGAEYAGLHPGGRTDAGFVQDLYQNALGRPPEAGIERDWVDALAHGASRVDVAVAVAEGAEARAHHVQAIELGWHVS